MTVRSEYTGVTYEIEGLMLLGDEVDPKAVVVPVWVAKQYREQVKRLQAELKALQDQVRMQVQNRCNCRECNPYRQTGAY